MQSITYPSKTFQADFEDLFSRGERFCILVLETEKKKSILLEEMNVIMTDREERSAFRASIAKFKLLDFYSALAPYFVNDRGIISYEDKGDLHIYIDPSTYRGS